MGPVTLALERGVCALIGANGAGKTTLLGAASGLLPLASGASSLGGHAIRGATRAEAMRSLGFLPQETQVPAILRVREAVSYAAWLKGVTAQAVGAAVSVALERVDLSELASKRVGSLSGGQKQRVCIAQAIVHGPTVLLLDEPSVGLDPAQRRGLYSIIDAVAADGAAVLLSTHNLDDVAAVADRVLVLRDGKVVDDRPVDRHLTVAERFSELSALVDVSMGSTR